ncbi:guanylate kinase [Myxosarcina sp. GI1]|uniref:guanylate kinase n=1 Tax=Myxosarcina sp. GI1 TaxID=1541065 RepID=UPI00055D3176|nr:guanylate kinase [Myxosarcina sp. GI1]
MLTGKLITIVGPSGVGKGSIARSLQQRHSEIHLSVSATTRKPRDGEIEGKDYYFLSKSEFEAAISNNEFLEWAKYAENYYGTPKTQVKQQIANGKLVLLEIELAGARQIAKTYPEALRIFILPPSLEELERRIRNRGKNSEESISQRLKIARDEIAAKDEFDVRVVNENLERAIAEVEAVIFKQ